MQYDRSKLSNLCLKLATDGADFIRRVSEYRV